MKTCTNCGTALTEQAAFCPTCGLAVPATESVAAPAMATAAPNPQEIALNLMQRMFKYERMAWKIGAIVWLVMAAFFGLFSLLYGFIGLVSMIEEPEMGGMMFGFGFYFTIFVAMYASVGIYNLMMVKRANHYMNTAHLDVQGALTRAGSVGMIVLGAMFNTVAMVFIIINFVNAKTNGHVLQNLAATKQQGQ